MKKTELSIGKVSVQVLNKIIFNNKYRREVVRKELIVGPLIGEDCSAIDFEDELCVLSSNPITGEPSNIGYLSVILNANNVFASGGTVLGIMLTVLLPINSTSNDLKLIIDGVYRAASNLKIEVLGGHTEVSEAVNKPVVVITVLGKTKDKNIIYTKGAEVGQDVVMTKWIGIQGTLIMANELKRIDKKNFGFYAETVRKFNNLLSVSVKEESIIARRFAVSSMHDIAEGGILRAAYELAEASKCGIQINFDNVQILDKTKFICRKFKVNPYNLISGGALLMTTFDGEKLVDIFMKKGINASIVGKITSSTKSFSVNNKVYDLFEPISDELYRFLKIL